jgi:hypothetical protein
MAVESGTMQPQATTHFRIHPFLINLGKGNLTIPVYDVYKPYTLLE